MPPLPDDRALQSIEALLKEGRSLSAWEIAKAYAPLKEWEGVKTRRIAASLARELGNYRLEATLHWVNARQHPSDHNAFLIGLCYRLPKRGPSETLDRIEARLDRLRGETSKESIEALVDLLAIKGHTHGLMRDFENAHKAVDEALALAPTAYWSYVQKSSILELEDRYEEALEVARKAVQLNPKKDSALFQLVDCLTHCSRDDEAIQILKEAHERTELPAPSRRLVSFFSEREDHEAGLFYLNEYERRTPLRDKSEQKICDRFRADFLYMAGDYEGCLALCDKANSGFHKTIAETMREPDRLRRKRKRLDVSFIRQHNMTCAPATLAALAAYWGRKFDHLAIADAICYEGTPGFKERAWAKANGFHAAEFRLTRDVLIELIDRGIPFTLATEFVAGAHLQACIGYDDRQGTVLLRDPTERHFGEVTLKGLLEDHPISGPRCMLLLPKEQISKIAGVELPDEAIFDASNQLALALDAHDLEGAKAALEAIPKDHPKAAQGALSIAHYQRNPSAYLQTVESLLERFPEHTPLRYTHLFALRQMNEMERFHSVLLKEIERPHCDPVFFSELGELLLRDVKNLPMADYYLRKAVRLRRSTGSVYASLAYCRWKERRFKEAVRYRRIASCLDGGNEWYASRYAEECRAIGQPEEGIAFLKQRITKYGDKDCGPWLTLAEELDAQNRTPEALALLERGISQRPDDGRFLLFSGKKLVLWGQHDRGEGLMCQARGKVREAEWHREMAQIAAFLGQRERSVQHWQSLLLIEPFNEEAYRATATHLNEGGGPEEAVRFLTAATTQYPKFFGLWCIRAQWESEYAPDAALASLTTALRLDPDSDWVLRQLALEHMDGGHYEAAIEAVTAAIHKSPNVSGSHSILAEVYERSGRLQEAKAAAQQAIQLSVDNLAASNILVRVATSPHEKLEALAFIAREMRAQVSDGSILATYRGLAYPHLQPQQLLDNLRGFCIDRPDLWQTWVTRKEQAIAMERLDEALTCAKELTERFPILPRAWLELGLVYREAKDQKNELAALEQAVALSPGWDIAAWELSTTLEAEGRYEEALKVLERDLERSPSKGGSYGYLSALLWKLGRLGEAFDKLAEGLRRAPSYSWGWMTITPWAKTLGREEEVVALLDSHRPHRAHLSAWWLQAAEVLLKLGRNEEALQAIGCGLERHPNNVALSEYKALLLSSLNRFEEALHLCEEVLKHHPNNREFLGRQAATLMESGRSEEAIDKMRSVVSYHPDYQWGYERLADWYEQRQEWKALIEVAQKIQRLDPRNALPYAYLANAEQKLGNRPAAKKAFEKAFELNPENGFSGNQLLSLQIEDGEFEQAEATLRKLEHYTPSATVVAGVLELAVARQDPATAKEVAPQLLARNDAQKGLIEWTGNLFQKAGWASIWNKFLLAEVKKENPGPGAFLAWIALLPANGSEWRGVWRLTRSGPLPPDLRANGWITLLGAIDSEKRWKVRFWVWRYRTYFRSRLDLWGAVGERLVTQNDYKSARRWLSDWKTRGEAVSCEALFNYAVAIEYTQDWENSTPIFEQILERYPTHSFANATRATLALQSALRFDLKTARAFEANLDTEKLTPAFQGYFALYQSLAAAAEKDYEGAREHYQRALSLYHQFRYDLGFKRYHSSAVAILARCIPSAKGKPRKILSEWGAYNVSAPSDFFHIVRWIAFIYILLKCLADYLDK